jgi:hypothetical protein
MALPAKPKMTEKSLAAQPRRGGLSQPVSRRTTPRGSEYPCGDLALKGRATNPTLLSPIDWPAPSRAGTWQGTWVLNCRGELRSLGGRTPFGPTED